MKGELVPPLSLTSGENLSHLHSVESYRTIKLAWVGLGEHVGLTLPHWSRGTCH